MLHRINFHPSDRVLRQFGFIGFALSLVVAARAWSGRGVFAHRFLADSRPAIALTLVALGLVLGTLSLVRPRANRLPFVALSVLTYPIGLIVSYALMASLFFLLVTPMGWLLRLRRSDPMRRRFERDRTTYWTKARPSRKSEDYFSQF